MALSTVIANVNTISNLALIVPEKNIGYQKQVGNNGYLQTEKEAPSDTPGYLFHYEGENAFKLKAEITDSYTEANSSVQDHIALNPEIVTVKGFIGELNDIFPYDGGKKAIDIIRSKLTTLGAYVPEITESALVTLNTALLLFNTAKTVVNTVSQDISQNVVSKQTWYFNQFYQSFMNRTLFTIQTPWNIMQNMAMESVTAIQNEDTRVVTDFEIVFKKIRIVQPSTSSPLSDKIQQERNIAQSSTSQNQGTNSLTEAALTFAQSLNGLTGG